MFLSIILTILKIIGVAFGTFVVGRSLIFFLQFLEQRNRKVNYLAITNTETQEEQEFDGKNTRNMTTTYKDFLPLYRANKDEWDFYSSSILKSQNVYYLGLQETKGIVVFVHFKSLWDYIKILKLIKQSDEAYDSGLYSEIADDVSDKLQKIIKLNQEKQNGLINDLQKQQERCK